MSTQELHHSHLSPWSEDPYWRGRGRELRRAATVFKHAGIVGTAARGARKICTVFHLKLGGRNEQSRLTLAITLTCIQEGNACRNCHALVVAFVFATCCTISGAQDLPIAGSINFHTGWKVTGDVITPADKHMLGHGSAVGTTLNENGSGPVHLGAADCFYTFLVLNGVGTNEVSCSFGDADGDRIFTSFTGNLSAEGDSGTNAIAGGTGKYAGIQGSGPWKCETTGSNGELQCAQRLDYRLP